ncbi:phosphoribosylanthranilate isomerase [Roseburia hominis]
METKIKICGLKRSEDVQMANRLKPDYIGFVFAHTRRHVDEERASALRKELSTEIPAVGVFVQEDIGIISRLCESGTIQMIQLHGEEDAAYIRRVREAVPEVPIIRAVRVRSREQILEAEHLDADYLLLDTYVKGTYGGSGQEFDKSLIPKLTKPYFLAGGLTGENVCGHVKACRPYAVDVSSAVETDGVKDEIKMKEFIERVRNYGK